MPFLFIGVFLIIVGFLLHHEAKRSHDHNGTMGSEHLIYAGVILVILYGILYRSLTLFF